MKYRTEQKVRDCNGRSSESHQVYLNGRVVTDEGEVKSLYSTRPDCKSARTEKTCLIKTKCMKRTANQLFLWGTIALVLSLTSCNKEKLHDTETSQRNIFGFFMVDGELGYYTFSVPDVFMMYVDADGFFSPSFGDGKAEIVHVGAVNDLLEVDRIPTNGWEERAEILPRHGYIVRTSGMTAKGKSVSRSYNYTRIFVESCLLTSEDGHRFINGELKIESPWR